MSSYDAVIIGAGASGMVAAIELARGGKKVALIERQNRGGKKILASGNGRCNIANLAVSSKNFHTRNRRLIQELLKNFPLAKIEKFFRGLGLEFISVEDGRLFPQSLSALSVLELLEAWIARLGIDCFYGVEDLTIKKGFYITFAKGRLEAKNLILATGSSAAPQLGGNSSGYEIARNFGHKVIDSLPALVPLTSSAKVCRALAGLKLSVTLRLLVDGVEITSKRGDLLFTKYGVSGLAILDISIAAVQALASGKKCSISIDYFDSMNQKEFLKYLKSRVDRERNLPLRIWLGTILHPKLAKEILLELGLFDASETALKSNTLKNLASLLKGYTIPLDGYRPMQYAEVALGGVDSKEIDYKTLESQKQKGLYFCGEILDTIGDRGGYNFYFAWATALQVAKSVGVSNML